jgi:anti-sigma regulatory factor (Ser/Thr protein kinase)
VVQAAASGQPGGDAAGRHQPPRASAPESERVSGDRGSSGEQPARPGNRVEGRNAEHEFSSGTLHILRATVLAHTAGAGIPESRATDVMLAARELAVNAVRHGGGTARLRITVAGGALHCEVTDPGAARSDGHRPAASAVRQPAHAAAQAEPWPFQPGHSLCLVGQAADDCTVVTSPQGSRVTVAFALPGAS